MLGEEQGGVEAKQRGWWRHGGANAPGEGPPDNKEEEDGEGRRQLRKAVSSPGWH